MRRRLLSSVVLVVACGGAPTAPASTPAPAPASASATKGPPPSPCEDGARYHDFDFWVGAWDVRDGHGAIVGHNRIERAHRGCALIEHWESRSGGTGTSTNFFDPARAHWRQVWVDGSGEIIELEGGLAGAAMVLEGPYTHADGTVTRMRGTWTPHADGSVEQRFDESKDGGATWTLWFDGDYRHPPR